MHPPLFDCLADLLGYPREDYPARVQALVAAAAGTSLADLANAFAAGLAEVPPLELEELYTRTFDLNPVCALEVGWHLFGEDYNRGLFLVKVRGLLAQHGVAEAAELPDHLSHVLRLLARLPRDEAGAFAYAIVQQAVAAMVKGLEAQDNPFEPLVQAVAVAVAELCPTELVEA